MFASYAVPLERPGENIPVIIPAADLVAGAVFFNALNISYTMRTDFAGTGQKVSVGYVYRFK